MRRAYVIHDGSETEAATAAGLADARFETRMFATSEALVGAARAFPPDLVVAPLGRPGIDGCDLVLALRSDLRTQRVPVMLIGESPVGGAPQEVGEHVHLVAVATPESISAAATDALACVVARPGVEARPERHLRVVDRTAVDADPADSLTSESFRGLLVEATALVTDLIGADFVAVLEQTSQQDISLVAAVGFDLPSTASPGQCDEMALLALQSGLPVVADDLRAETRFVAPAFLIEAGAVGAVCAVIGSTTDRAAVLGAYSTSPRVFSDADVDALRYVAQLISTAVAGRRLHSILSAHEADARSLLDVAARTTLGGDESSATVPVAAASPRFAADRALGTREGLSIGSTADAAHAFGNILQVIGGFTEVLGDRIGYQAELDEIARAVERGSGLADCMHTLQAPSEWPSPRSDAVDVLHRVEQSFAGLPSVAVSIAASDDTPPAAIDPDELALSLDALVRNATATARGASSVHITASQRWFGNEASAAGVSAGTYVVFGIRCDRMPGSAPLAGPPIVLDPGIGLIETQKAVSRAGGAITFSRAGVDGTSFTIYVPVAGASAAVGAHDWIGSAA